MLYECKILSPSGKLKKVVTPAEQAKYRMRYLEDITLYPYYTGLPENFFMYPAGETCERSKDG